MPNIICNTWEEAKGFILKYPELLNHVMLNNKSIIDMCNPDYQMDWSATPSEKKVAQLINHIESILYPKIKTFGDNEVYKSYLNTPEWINKKNEILKRDFHTCTRCYNSIELKSLSELRKYLNNEKSFEIIRCKCKPYPIVTDNEMPKPYSNGKNQIKYKTEYHADIIPHGYVSSIGLYLYEYNSYETHSLNIKKRIKGIFFSTQNSLPSQNKWKWGHYSYPMITDYNNNEWFMYWQNDELGDTNNKLILSHCVSEDGSYYYNGKYRGIGILSYNQYSIIFPLYSLLTPMSLDVHHKIYKKTNGEYIKPWEYNNDELITLCHNCHIDVHKEPISIRYE